MNYDIERDSALRGYWIKGVIIQKMCLDAMLLPDKKEIFVPDSLLRILYESLYPHRSSWQEWRDYEQRQQIEKQKFDAEVARYKKLNPDRSVSLKSSAADIVAKSEQLAERELNKDEIK